MIRNKDLLAYFYQERNIVKLEELIEESLLVLRCCKHPQSADEWEQYCQNNIEVTAGEQANELLDRLVYPEIQEIMGLAVAMKPEVVVVGNGFFKDAVSIQRGSWKYFALGGAVLFPLSMALGAAIPEAILLSGLLPIANSAKGVLQYKDAGGWVDPIFKTTAYVKSGLTSHFVYALTHEVEHCIRGQNTSIMSNMVEAYSGRYSLYAEGSAELVTQKVIDEIDGGKWDDYKHRYAISRANQRLLNSYHELCRQLHIPEDEKKFKKMSDFPKGAYDCNWHDMGFSVMKLLTAGRDDGVYREILMNTFKL